MVEDAEEGLGLDCYADGGGGGCLCADCGGGERAREVQVVRAHLRRWGVVERSGRDVSLVLVRLKISRNSRFRA